MYTNIADTKRRNRLPADSGEWRLVPLSFKHLPLDGNTSFRQAFAAASLNTLLQSIFGALLIWFAIEYLNERHYEWLLVAAFGIGLVTSAYAGGVIAHQHWFSVRDTMGVVMQGQLWWSVLILIPCYGWAVLIFLSMPCAFGSLIGSAIGARIGHPQGAWT
jgi:hypothetical protein